ncbi:hypothetical protein MP228_006676 [Amoeboaphelidium protococcarum]|nr:hypothetical protein MP228_006676 [Amoeboaphelidium protococcarum]
MSAKAITEYDGKKLLAKWLQCPPSIAGLQTQPQELSAGGAFSGSSKLARVVLDVGPKTSYKPSADSKPVSQKSQSTQSASREQVKARLQPLFDQLERQEPWLLQEKLVVKPDQLIKRRGKLGLLGINLDWQAVKQWIVERADTRISVDGISGTLNAFIIEPFVPHPQETEHYVCIQSVRDGDLVFFYDKGGIDVGDVDSKAQKLLIPTGVQFQSMKEQVVTDLLKGIPEQDNKRAVLYDFLLRLHTVYADLNFTYLEINPLVVLPAKSAQDPPQVIYLDLAAKIDQTAEFESGKYWSQALSPLQLQSQLPNNNNSNASVSLTFPAPFGRELTPEEAYIAELDSKTGASLKLTVLNPEGRIWTMVAGGGASVVYSDAIAAHGFAHELANYGEYSGAPSETQTYEYAKTLLDLMTRQKHKSESKVLLIGGGIANFTNVAATFKGIVRALREFKQRILDVGCKIWVRRGGPNWQEGLKLIRGVGEELDLDLAVYGPETHITAIVEMALGKSSTSGDAQGPQKGGSANKSASSYTEQVFYGQSSTSTGAVAKKNKSVDQLLEFAPADKNYSQPIASFPSTPVQSHPWYQPFTKQTKSFIYGMQPRAVQGMLDFDHMCKREAPSVAAMIYPFGGSHVQKFYWGDKEMLLPVMTSVEEAVQKFPDVDTVINFASFRSVYDSTMQLLKFSSQLKTIAIIAEGVPERRAKQILKTASDQGVLIIGPATVGGIKPGCFKIGNTGGMIDNIIGSKLYRAGSVAYVSKSGGMSNELNNLLARCTDGVYEGIAIGGDRYPGSTFFDHLIRFQDDPNCKMLLLLGEVGGVEEYKVAEAIKSGRITKPVVAWCIGTCANMFGAEVQFGHAGALANSNLETALAKNDALRQAGAIVPKTFEDLPVALEATYKQLLEKGLVKPFTEPEVPKVPIDYAWAQELGLVRKPASFVSTICDDRGQELLYAGMPISKVFEEDIGVGGVLSLLWFKRRLPQYATKFVEMVLMLTADHGPAVSGAHNTIVTARAGKDLVSSLVAGLLTIGDRFGGALDGAAEQFSAAYDQGLSPQEFVDSLRKQHKLILGIGHKIKSRTNPDLRVSILTDYAKRTFPQTPLLDYARKVELITTAKKDNLILNVDGAIGVLFVDLLRHSGAFSREEAEEYIKIGTLNGLFVLGRSLGFIGHFIDQKRLKQGLYRHPWDDISYLVGMEGQGSSVLVSGASLGNVGDNDKEGAQQ